MTAIGQDTLKTRKTLDVEGKPVRVFLDPRGGEADRRRVAPAGEPEGAARERAPLRERHELHDRGREGDRRLAREGQLHQGSAVPARAHPDAGFHGRSRRGRSRRDARRHHQARRRPGEGEPAGAGRSRDRPLGDGGRVRAPGRAARRTSISSSSATASATSSCAGARRRSTISASFRPAPASAIR